MTLSVADLALFVASISITGAVIEAGKAIVPREMRMTHYSQPLCPAECNLLPEVRK